MFITPDVTLMGLQVAIEQMCSNMHGSSLVDFDRCIVDQFLYNSFIYIVVVFLLTKSLHRQFNYYQIIL